MMQFVCCVCGKIIPTAFAPAIIEDAKARRYFCPHKSQCLMRAKEIWFEILLENGIVMTRKHAPKRSSVEHLDVLELELGP
jgi:hypothetical protein